MLWNLLVSIFTYPVEWFWEKLEDYQKHGNIFKIICLFLFSLLGIGALTLASLMFFEYLFTNHFTLLIVFFAIWWVYNSIHNKNIQQAELQNQMILKDKEQQALIEQEQAQQNYALLQKVVFTILADLSEVIKIKKPHFLSEITAETKTYHSNGIFYYQFCCLQSDANQIEPDVVKAILQQRIAQMLMAGEIHGITQAFYVYEGRTYPLIHVVDVECIGINFYITLTIVNEAFCKDAHMRALAKQQITQQNKFEFSDKDF